QQMCAFLDQQIADLRASFASGAPAPQTVIGRLVHMQNDPSTHLADDQIRSQLIGSITGTVDTTARAVLGTFQTLFEMPEQLAAAQKAAAANDDATLMAIIWEAMRFHPQNTIIPRLCVSAYTVAHGTDRAITIQPGTLVMAANFSAMFDRIELDAPEEFRPNRPSSNYIHFGYAQHRCLGEYIAQVQLRETVKRVLLLKGLHKVTSPDDPKVAYGNLPTAMSVTFEA
ncbi:MAG TPA: cytochrome P450, partial [Acidobacteriota bacterium]|nr:cytochrome P450 [Acidobacteriota bacterium]